jgi:predicted RND superfamily exporter protein
MGGGGGGATSGVLRVLQRVFAAYVDRLLDHPRLAAAVVVTLSAFWAAQLPALRVEIDPDANLPQAHAYIRALHLLESKFGEKNLIVVGLFPTDGDVFTPGFLAKVQRVTRRIRELPGVVPSSFLGLASPLAKSIEGRDDAVIVQRIVDRTPTTHDEAREVRRRAYLNPFFSGTIVAADRSATAIVANFRLTPLTPGYPEIHDAVARVVAAENDGTFVARYGGPIAVFAAMARVTERTVLLFPLAMLVIAAIHYEAFRTVQAMVLPLVTALLAVVWALGFMGLLRVPLDPFNTTTPILVLAVAAGHAVQILKRYYEEYERHGDTRTAIRTAMLRLGPVMLTAGAVAALSFFSLTIFATATIRNFGLLTGFGILAAVVVEMTLIPAIRMLLPPRAAELRREAGTGALLERLLGRIARTVAARPRATVVGCAVVVAVGIVGAARVHVDTTLKRQFRGSDPVRRDDDALNAAFGGTNTLVVLVEGPDAHAIERPEALAAMQRLQAMLAADREVGATRSIVDVVVAMHHALDGGVRTVASSAPDGAPDALPSSAELVAQYLFLYSLSADPGDLDTQIDADHRVAPIRVFLKTDSTEYTQALIDRVHAFAATAFPPGYRLEYSGSNASNAALTDVMVRGKLLNMLQIAAIIVLVSAIMLRSIVAGLLVAAPLATAVAVNLGVMGFAGVPLDIVTAPIAAMAVGIGADYAIYFLFRFREELRTSRTPALALSSALRTAGKAIVYVSSAIAGGYLVLCVSGFVYHVELGILVALAMVVSSAASITLLPALLLIARPRFLFDRA